jgi:plastocyanin
VPLLPADGCAAGLEFHELSGLLWGDIFYVPRDAQGTGTYLHPQPGQPYVMYAARADGAMVSAAGHVHQNGIATIVVNLGPPGSPCEGDLDGDGLPGTTLLRSQKFERNPAAGFASEDAQMGITQPGWRAPIRAGDRIALYGLYRNDLHASYQAMTFLLAHIDEQQPPGPYATGICQLADVAPSLVGAQSDPTVTVPSRPWSGPELPVCGVPGEAACDRPVPPMPQGEQVPVVGIAGFTYMPGDLHLTGSLGAPVRVPLGQSLTFVNLDTAGIVKHSVSSCPWPCNGPYVANYPQPDGLFESGSMGNLDRFDQGSIPPDAGDDPLWSTPADLAPGLYAYYCRLHPSMRGAFEVLAT